METIFPKDLLEQCLSCVQNQQQQNDNTTTNNPGELLELVLSVLLDDTNHDDDEEHNDTDADPLPSVESLRVSWTKQHEKDTGVALDTTACSLPCLMYSILESANTESRRQKLFSILSQQNQLQATIVLWNKWYVALQVIALLLSHNDMTAFEVHSVALQSMLLLGTFPSNSSTSSSRVQYNLFWTLVVLLANWSLQKCHHQILEAASLASTANNNPQKAPPRIRFKRIKSILLETIQLYQRHAFQIINDDMMHEEDEHDMDTDNDETTSSVAACPSELSVPLWTQHLVPTGMTLWSQVPTTNTATSVFWPALRVSVASHLLAIHFSTSSLQQAGITQTLYYSLVSQNGDDLSSLLSWLCHPWRVESWDQQYHRFPWARSRPPRREDRLDWWTLERNYQANSSDDDDMEYSDDDERPPDDFEAIDTSWNELGVALLSCQAWQDEARPLVFRPQFEWKLWFPHVAILMNHNPDQQPHLSITTSAVAKVELTLQGISLLQVLLPVLPQHSLALSNSFSLAGDISPDSTHHVYNSTGTVGVAPPPKPTNRAMPRPPDHPLGTFQLLLNSIVAATTQSSASSLPNAMIIFQLCKDMLSKYTPSCQVVLVWDYLLPSCPHPGLKPKLLDMLRPLLSVVPLQNDQDAQNANARLRGELEAMLSRDLGQYIVQSAEGTIVGIQDVQDLIDQCEYLVSACALIQLGWRNRFIEDGDEGQAHNIDAFSRHPRSIPVPPQKVEGLTSPPTTTLEDVGQAVRVQLEKWNSGVAGDSKMTQGTMQGNEELPDQYFRLNLLEMAIQQIRDTP